MIKGFWIGLIAYERILSIPNSYHIKTESGVSIIQ
jgi:hypothetical protein